MEEIRMTSARTLDLNGGEQDLITIDRYGYDNSVANWRKNKNKCIEIKYYNCSLKEFIKKYSIKELIEYINLIKSRWLSITAEEIALFFIEGTAIKIRNLAKKHNIELHTQVMCNPERIDLAIWLESHGVIFYEKDVGEHTKKLINAPAASIIETTPIPVTKPVIIPAQETAEPTTLPKEEVIEVAEEQPKKDIDVLITELSLEGDIDEIFNTLLDKLNCFNGNYRVSIEKIED